MTKHLILIVLLLAFAGCDSGNGSEEAALPTRVILPSDTPTATPTETSTATTTPSVTPSSTNTPTITPTNTVTPTDTPTPTNTATPTATATSTPAFTNTPTATLTPTATATSAGPQILSFTSSVPVAQGGSAITLAWETVSDSAQIEQLDQQGQRLQVYSVTPTGTLPVTVPNTGSQVIFRLTAIRGSQQATQSLPIQVQIVCSTPWFFANIPADAGCPLGPPVTVTGKVQLFQQGLMFNVLINGEDRVYGLNTTNGRYMVYTNVWDGVTTNYTTCGTPPAGLLPPENVFNWAYHNTNGTIGLWCGPDGIGWGTAAANLSALITIQFEGQGTASYVNLPGYGTIRISGTPVTGTWTRVTG